MLDASVQDSGTQKFNRKQARIINAAIAVFNERGLKGTRISDVAASVGLATTSVTYYFKRKEELAAACFMQTISEFQQLARMAQSERKPKQRLKKFLQHYFSLRESMVHGDHPPLMLFNELRAMDRETTKELFDAYINMFRDIRALIAEEDENSPAQRVRLNTDAHLLLSHILWVPVWLGRYTPQDYPRLVDHLCELLSGGALSSGQVWQPPHISAHEAPVDSRNTFLRAATAMINDRGYRGASVEKIATSLDVTKGSFYHHYDSKEELAIACFDYTFEIIERVFAEAPLDLSHGQRLNYIVANLVHCQLAPSGPLLTMGSISTLAPQVRVEIVERYWGLTRRLADIIIDGIVQGSVTATEPLLAAELIIQTINAAPEISRWAPGLDPHEAMIALMQPLVEGMVKPDQTTGEEHA